MTQRADAAYQRARRAEETPEARAERLKRDREQRAAKRAAARTGTEKPGPRPLIEGDPTQSRSVTLPQSYWDIVRDIGDGVYSAGLRIIVEQAGARRKRSVRRK